MTGPEIKLEKKVDAKLDTNEKANLEKLTAADFKNQLQKLKDEKFDLSVQNKGVRLEDIVKNYNTSTSTIDLKGEQIPVVKGSDLAAWIQVLLVADGRNIRTNTTKSKRGIDGDIGHATVGQIENYKDLNNSSNAPKSKVEFPDSMTAEDIKAIRNGLNRFIFDTLRGASVLNFMQNAKVINKNYQLDNSYGFTSIDANNHTVTIKVKYDHVDKTYTIPLASLLESRKKGDSNRDLNDNAEDVIFAKFNEIYKDNNSNIRAEQIKEERHILDGYKADFKEAQSKFETGIKPSYDKISFCKNYIKKYSDLKTEVSNSSLSLKSKNLHNKEQFVEFANSIKDEIDKKVKPIMIAEMESKIKSSFDNLKKANQKTTDIQSTTNLNSYQNRLSAIEGLANLYKKDGANTDKYLTEITEQKDIISKMKYYLDAKIKIESRINDFKTRYNKKMSPAEGDKLRAEIRSLEKDITGNGIYYPSLKKFDKQIFADVGKSADYQKYIKQIKDITKNF